MTGTAFLGRQPILDRARRSYGYELLYRSGPHTQAFFEDPDDATRCVVERTMLEWGIDRVVGNRIGFINSAFGFLQSGLYRVLPPRNIVIELLEGMDFDDEAIEVIREARAAGYRLALDDVVDAERLAQSEVVRMVGIIKVDLRAATTDLDQLVTDLRRLAPRAKLLAEKVETLDDFRTTLDLGFDLFQGYFFAEPELLETRTRPVHTGAALTLLAEVHRPDISIDRLAELVNSDPTLAYRLLLLVNSSALGLSRRVESVHQAIVLLGIEQVRHIASLLALSANAITNEELVILAATRARMAQIVADPDDASGAFTVGLLSVIDTIFQQPMAELVADLPLSSPVSAALVDGAGTLGRLLGAIRAYEQADLETLDELRPGAIDQMREAFGSAADWAETLRREVLSV